MARRQRRTPEADSTPELAPGLYARLDGVDHPLGSRGGGWVLWADRQTPGFTATGFTKHAMRRFFRTIAPDERMECFRITRHGSYRGLTIEVHPGAPGQVMAVSRDPRSRDAGFEGLDRDQWSRSISRDDPHLQVTTARTPVPAPWTTSRS